MKDLRSHFDWERGGGCLNAGDIMVTKVLKKDAGQADVYYIDVRLSGLKKITKAYSGFSKIDRIRGNIVLPTGEFSGKYALRYYTDPEAVDLCPDACAVLTGQLQALAQFSYLTLKF